MEEEGEACASYVDQLLALGSKQHLYIYAVAKTSYYLYRTHNPVSCSQEFLSPPFLATVEILMNVILSARSVAAAAAEAAHEPPSLPLITNLSLYNFIFVNAIIGFSFFIAFSWASSRTTQW